MFGHKTSGGGGKVKSFVREHLASRPGAAQEPTIVVSELACSEPGCPPIETVIAIFHGPGDARRLKLHKPMAEITRGDVVDLLNASSPGGEN